MGYILKNTSGLVNTRLTDTGRLKLSQGNFNISYFQIGDSEVTYNTLPSGSYNQFNSFVLEPSFNAQNSSGVPQSNKENVKYPFYVDGTTGNTYGIPFMDSIISPVFNTASPRGFFSGNTTADTINWSALTNNLYAINSNYIVPMNSLNGSNLITIIYSGCNTPIRDISVGDIITIIYDGTAISDCVCYNVPTPTPTPTISVTPTSSPAFGITPTPSSTYNPCNLTPTPTPTATCCITPTPSKPCPPVPEPDCVVDFTSCYPILTYKVIEVCSGYIRVDRDTPNYSYLNDGCFARTIVYPPTLTSLYDSVTPLNHWSNDVINFETVCYTDELDVKVWNMNIPWSENPAGLNSANNKDYTQFGSINYLGSKEYFGYASSSGQTDTSFVYYYDSLDNIVRLEPEEQKAIAIIHYTNQTVDLFYGEKFALEPFDDTTDDTTGQARNFKVHIPWLMWHKNPECCYGQTFWVDPPGYENLKIFETGPYYLKSTKNPDMNDPGIRYYNLYDTNTNFDGLPNRVGKVFPDSKIIIFDDEEIVAAMSYKSNRNWTLPAPQISLITPNTCGQDNNTTIGILTGISESLYVTYRFTNDTFFTNSLHCNYYRRIDGPNTNCSPNTSQNVALRFGSEFGCLSVLNDLCWSTGFTMHLENSGVYDLIPFTPTYSTKNGYPIFYHLSNTNGLLNFYFDGVNWIFDVFNIGDFTTTLTTNPLGVFTYNNIGIVSGFNSCYVSKVVCAEICESGSTCTNEELFPQLSGSTLIYTNNINTYEISYSGSNWNFFSGSTLIGTLTGLTSNDFPFGSWSSQTALITGLTTSDLINCYSASCECYEFSATTNDTQVSYGNCDYVITESDLLASGQTFSACVLTFNGAPIEFDISGSSTSISCTGSCSFSAITATCPTTCVTTSGFYGEKFEIICQKVLGNERPNSSEWKIIDFTDQISAYTINGYVTASALTATTFVITQDLYDSAPFYDLNDYIDLTPNGSTSPQLNFGDEYYFYGNIETDIQATIYEMRYKINLSQVEFQTSSNPTWKNTFKPYVTEIGLYDSDKDLVIISKMQSPILRQGIQQFLIKFDI